MRIIAFISLVSLLCFIGIGIAAEAFYDRRAQILPARLSDTHFEQSALDPPVVINWQGYKLEQLARVNVSALVIRREKFWYGEKARLSPSDVVLGWGPLADESVLRKINFRQWGRYYSWYADKLPVPANIISTHTANVHLVPSNEQIRLRMRAIKEGDLVTASGALVIIGNVENAPWVSSLSREDRGPGSCELLWVEQLNLNPH